MAKVIIFGATGTVASATARAAHARGTSVVLAARDPTKPISALTPEQEHQGSYQRIQADLSDPESIRLAVTSTNATRAFVYTVFDAPDHMRASLEAMKSAGIEHVVYLSSFAVKGEPGSVGPENFIAHAHARVEMSLADVFGASGYVAVRPSFYATNIRWWLAAAAEGRVGMAYPEAKFDLVVPEDIGRVCGTLLAQGSGMVQGNYVNLLGQEELALGDAVRLLSRETTGKEVEVVTVGEEEEIECFVAKLGFPEPLARAVVQQNREQSLGLGRGLVNFATDTDFTRNVYRITGSQSTGFREWAQQA
ncbi:SDR family oxidoreductase [Aspergillus brunneoviolaceus CBS 621.78]|uniref:NAD(P)-binding protein n=1 Tax=Aspergillus brunneoviolaceus CBS 621.78 TaxID=1450534 RepID=A0ACD1GDX2_9EURO|nr:NAD(P)-binding protein [Aspergillus brunneoviolaceus CBS 621.78]RAH47373.1 NAD(P)-binding protein [Aspergillus brunneoviolaceus CBS 621.78]